MLASGDEHYIRSIIDILRMAPYKSPEEKKIFMKKLKAITDGFAAVTDSPFCQFAPELLELYPDAMVICTVRDPAGWAKSMGGLQSAATQNMLRTLVWWVPCARYFMDFVDALVPYWESVYAQPGEPPGNDLTWERHIAMLKKTIPEDKLVFFDVREGWGPLCKALNVDVPEGVEFPRVNDGAAMDEFAKKQIVRGLGRWAVVVGVASIAIAMGYRYLG